MPKQKGGSFKGAKPKQKITKPNNSWITKKNVSKNTIVKPPLNLGINVKTATKSFESAAKKPFASQKSNLGLSGINIAALKTPFSQTRTNAASAKTPEASSPNKTPENEKKIPGTNAANLARLLGRPAPALVPAVAAAVAPKKERGSSESYPRTGTAPRKAPAPAPPPTINRESKPEPSPPTISRESKPGPAPTINKTKPNEFPPVIIARTPTESVIKNALAKQTTVSQVLAAAVNAGLAPAIIPRAASAAATTSIPPEIIQRTGTKPKNISGPPPLIPPKVSGNSESPPAIGTRGNKIAIPSQAKNAANSKKILSAQEGINSAQKKIKDIPVDEFGKALDPSKQSELNTQTKELEKHTSNLTNEYKKFNANNQGNLVKQISSNVKTPTVEKTALESKLENNIAKLQQDLRDKEAMILESAKEKEANQNDFNKSTRKVTELSIKYEANKTKRNAKIAKAQQEYNQNERRKDENRKAGRPVKNSRSFFSKIFTRTLKRRVNSQIEKSDAEKQRYETSVSNAIKEARKQAELNEVKLRRKAIRNVDSEEVAEGIQQRMADAGLTPDTITKIEAKELKKEVKAEIAEGKKSVKQLAKEYEEEHKEEIKAAKKERRQREKIERILKQNKLSGVVAENASYTGN